MRHFFEFVVRKHSFWESAALFASHLVSEKSLFCIVNKNNEIKLRQTTKKAYYFASSHVLLGKDEIFLSRVLHYFGV